MKTYILIFLSFVLITSCSKDDIILDDIFVPQSSNAKILTLKVDYLTNDFEGGIETTYSSNSTSFTISNLYTPPSDFGFLTLKYQELNEVLFSGGIYWMGLGEISYPLNILPSSKFDLVTTNDFVSPKAGFENVFNPDSQSFDYTPVWTSIQKLVKVREYLKANPNATIKLFLYTPSVGFGNPADWDWYVFIKN